MGNVSTTAAEMQPVTELPLEKVNECAKYYFARPTSHNAIAADYFWPPLFAIPFGGPS